jgi:glycerol kinase
MTSFFPQIINLILIQTQADLISIPVYRPKMRETTALGAAIAAGLAVGMWRNFAELRDINRAGGAVFEPQVRREESAAKFGEWEKAVQMSRGWVGPGNSREEAEGGKNSATLAPVKESRDLQTVSPYHSSLVDKGNRNMENCGLSKSGYSPVYSTLNGENTALETHYLSKQVVPLRAKSDTDKALGVTATVKEIPQTSMGEIKFPSLKTPLVSFLSDMLDPDEEDLYLELRKVEILQRLKALRKSNVNYY